MSNVVRNASIIGGLVMTVAGGTALYMAGLTPHAPPPATVAVPPPTPTTTQASGPADQQPAAPVPLAALQNTPPPAPAGPGQDPTIWPDGVASERFNTYVKPFTLAKDSVAYAAASGDAPQLYPLRAGTAVASAEKSADGKWVIAMTEDGKAAYLLTADLGPYDPSKAPPPDAPATISGAARVIDTGLLDVTGQQVALNGIRGERGGFAAKMQSLIDKQGPDVTCTPMGGSYQCKLPNGLDIARAALFNGAAEPADNASDDYRAQSAAAKAAHRGIWN